MQHRGGSTGVLELVLGCCTRQRIPTRPGQVKSYPINEASPSVALELDFASKVWDIGSSMFNSSKYAGFRLRGPAENNHGADPSAERTALPAVAPPVADADNSQGPTAMLAVEGSGASPRVAYLVPDFGVTTSREKPVRRLHAAVTGAFA